MQLDLGDGWSKLKATYFSAFHNGGGVEAGECGEYNGLCEEYNGEWATI